jgi:hypothetical protein
LADAAFGMAKPAAMISVAASAFFHTKVLALGERICPFYELTLTG